MSDDAVLFSVDFAPGDLIIEAGKPSTALYIIQEGSVEVFHTRLGNRVRIAKLGKGDLIGEVALISDSEHQRSVAALTPVKCAMISKIEFEEELDRASPFVRAVMKTLVRKLRTTTSKAFGDQDEERN